MAMRFIMDAVEGHRIVDGDNGIEIDRMCLVTDVPIAAGDSDPEVFIKILADAGCPLKGSSYPSSLMAFCKLRERELVNVRDNKSATLRLKYRGTSLLAGGGIEYTLEDASVTDTIQTYATGDGSKSILLRYKKGVAALAVVYTEPFWRKAVPVPKLRSNRVLRAKGRANLDDWLAVRDSVKVLRNHINSTPWGGDPRGTWMFMGPTTLISTASTQVDIQLDFLEGIDGHYPIAAYFDEFGVHPADCATEAQVRSLGVPAVGDYKDGNGLGIVSEYIETNFNTAFNFTP